MPTAPTITGAIGTTAISSDNRKIDMADRIAMLQPDETPYVVLAKKLPKAVAVNPEYSHLEVDQEPRFDQINNGAGYASGATSWVVDHGTYFAQHDIVFVPRTGETVRVQAVATNTLTVVRGVGSTAAAVNDNEELLIMGSAQPEGDTSKPARAAQPSKITNYTQIFTEPWELTETARNSENTTTPDEWARQAASHGVEHLKELEFALLFGNPAEDLTGSQPRRTTGGARHFITTNVTDVGGTMTEAEFWAALRPIFRYGSREKVWLSGSLPLSVINQYAQSKIQVISPTQNQYGLNITQFNTPFGSLNVMPADYAFDGATLGGEALVLDLGPKSNKKYRYIKNRDTHVLTNIQAPDADTRKDQFLSEIGMQHANEQQDGRITNITG